jgi:hypothetical protein
MTDANNYQLYTAHLLRELEFFIQKYPNDMWVSSMKSIIREALAVHKEIRIDENKVSNIYQI